MKHYKFNITQYGRTKFFILAFAVLICTGFKPIYAQEKKINLYYFYITGCSSCKETKEILDKLEGSEDLMVSVLAYNTIETENQDLLEKYFKEYEVKENDEKVPIIFVGNRYFSGKDQISQGLLDYVKSKDIPGTRILNKADDGRFIENRFLNFKVLGVLLVGIANGLSPCSLSILILFISLMLGKREYILKLGLVYCLGKFITYFFLGTAFYNIIKQADLDSFNSIFNAVMVAFFSIFIFLNIRDYFYAKNERYEKLKLQLPKPLKHWNNNLVKKINKWQSPGIMMGVSFGMGILTSIGEFLCTGQIYLTTLLFMIHEQNELSLQAVSYFSIYNIGFIIPFILITIVIYKGSEIFDITEKVRNNIPLIKLLNALIFLILIILLILK